MKPSRGFPPGVGWIPLTVAVGIAAVAAFGAVVPQFGTKVVGTTTATGGNQTVGGPAASGAAAAGNGGTAGHTVTTGGGSGPGGSSGGSGGAAGAQCAPGKNGGATAPGVTASGIHVASTIVTTGVGSGFLKEAVDGMQAAINEQNNAGGICGRRISLSTVNDNWDRTSGQNDISNYINSGNVFSLVGEPDSEGLGAAIDSGTIDQAQIPVVGTDGMLADQYFSPWVFPVASSTVTNMHVAAQYAINNLKAKSIGIVFDTHYKFGKEGAYAFDQEVKRLTGRDINGFDPGGNGCNQRYCGIDASQSGGYSTAIKQFDDNCSPCDVVMMLLEPQPMETWMKGEENAPTAWKTKMMGGEPLFDDNLGSTCGGDCSDMIVWTGYHPAIQPFDTEKPVNQYINSLKSVCPSCDAHNEFTEGAYLGTKMFIDACKLVGPNLTRAALRQVLETQTFPLGLTAPLHYGSSLPHVANAAMAAFGDNAQGSFNGWNYLETGFLADPAVGQDFKSQ